MTDYGFARLDRYRQLPHPDALDAWLQQPNADDRLFATDQLFDRAERLLKGGVLKSALDLDQFLDREAGLVPPDDARAAIRQLDELAELMVPAESLRPVVVPHQVFGLDHSENRERLRAAVARAYRVASRYADRYADRKAAITSIGKALPVAQQTFAQLRPLVERLRDLQRPWRYAGEEGSADIDRRVAEALKTLDHVIGGGARWISAMKPAETAGGTDDDREEDGIGSEAGEGGLLIRETIDTSDVDVLAWHGVPSSSMDAIAMLAALEDSRERLQQDDASDGWKLIEHRYLQRKDDLTRARRGWQWHEFEESSGFLRKVHRPDRFFLLRLGEIFSVNFGRPATWYRRSEPGEDGDPFAEFVDVALRCCNWPTPGRSAKKRSSKISFAGQEERASDPPDLLITDDALRGVAKGFPPGLAWETMEWLASACVRGISGRKISYSGLLTHGLLIDMNAWTDEKL